MKRPTCTNAAALVLLVTLNLPLSASGWSCTNTPTSRKAFLRQSIVQPSAAAAAVVGTCSWFSAADAAHAKCTDIESCREIGERRDAELQAKYPITKLGDGLQYKILSAGVGDAVVTPKSNIRVAYSISQGNGSYMYSRGMGYNKVDAGSGQKVNDLGLDSLAVQMGSTQIPVGIQRALVGAKRGERRRIECPAKLGFETSNWEPKPSTFRGERQMIDYQNTLTGRGGGLAFPAPTVWDVEVVSIRQ